MKYDMHWKVRRVGLVAAVFMACAGCRAPLLASGEERSQFDRYDKVREQSAPPHYMDEYGRRRPNLRGRLLRRD
ncbi:MAG: hypothetical protein D6695_05060 [Planctomycetota bacterium]|nr:MAG: hypothetical protein D6695_05060 [Planctomycetota bacterium]